MHRRFPFPVGCLVLLLAWQVLVPAVREVATAGPFQPAPYAVGPLPSAADTPGPTPESPGVDQLPPVRGPITWDLATVDWPGNVGQYTSLRKDSAGRPRISYYDVSSGALKYAAFNGSTWLTETVDTANETGLYTSLALDTADNPHISYYDQTNGDLRYAKYVGTGGNCGVTHPGTWQCDAVDSTGDVGQYTSLELDAQDYPHISYYDVSNRYLKYAYQDAPGWHVETVDDSPKVGHHTSLALDAAGRAHISYYDGAFTDGDLMYARFVGSGQGNCSPTSSWQCTTVDNVQLQGLFTSIALDSAGTPHISYFGQDAVRYASYVGAGGNCTASDWQCDSVIGIGSGETNGYTSLALDQDDRPFIAHYHTNNNRLQYAYGVTAGSGNCGGTLLNWECEVVDPAPGTGMFNAIALDSAGRPGISYYDLPNGNLQYADGTLCVPVQAATIAGPVFLEVGEVGVYTATYLPPTATLPMTITWDNSTVGPTAAYSWTTPGIYTITVTATNPCGTITGTFVVALATSLAHRIELPVVFRGWNACLIRGTGYWESEPNDAFFTANGPLCSRVSYFGHAYLDDYWYFHSGPGPCTIRLENPDAYHVQILLYNPLHTWMGWDNTGNSVLSITEVLTVTGDYFLRVYADMVFTQPYTLQITFP